MTLGKWEPSKDFQENIKRCLKSVFNETSPEALSNEHGSFNANQLSIVYFDIRTEH